MQHSITIVRTYKKFSHAGPEGSRKLKLPDFMTTERYGGRLSALHTGRFYPQEYSWYSFSLGAESTPGPWFGRKEISSDNTGNRSRDRPTSGAAP